MRGEEAYVWATVYAAVCAVHGREAALKEADKAVDLFNERRRANLPGGELPCPTCKRW